MTANVFQHSLVIRSFSTLHYYYDPEKRVLSVFPGETVSFKVLNDFPSVRQSLVLYPSAL